MTYEEKKAKWAKMSTEEKAKAYGLALIKAATRRDNNKRFKGEANLANLMYEMEVTYTNG